MFFFSKIAPKPLRLLIFSLFFKTIIEDKNIKLVIAYLTQPYIVVKIQTGFFLIPGTITPEAYISDTKDLIDWKVRKYKTVNFWISFNLLFFKITFKRSRISLITRDDIVLNDEGMVKTFFQWNHWSKNELGMRQKICFEQSRSIVNRIGKIWNHPISLTNNKFN